jgi:hypothetical protein
MKETTKFLDKVSISHNDNKENYGVMGYDGIPS